MSPEANNPTEMKTKISVLSSWLIGFSLFYQSYVHASNEVPCLIFSGDSKMDYCLDLSEFNRIYIGEDGIKVKSSETESNQEINISYLNFKQFKIGNATPSSGIRDIDSSHDAQLIYRSDTNSLYIESSSDSNYKLDIYNANGQLLVSSQLNCNQYLPLKEFVHGIYIAVAINEKSKLTLKFIIR